jgi:UDP-glucose 4-epimerase
MKVLVTGAAGFIGSRLCGALAAMGHGVIALHRPAHARAFPGGVEPIACDLAAPDGLGHLPRVDTIIHLAQSSRFRDFPLGARDMFDVNLRATFELLEFARTSGVKHFVYASSGGIYGQGAAAFSDAAPLVMAEPLGFYLSSKLAGELLVDNYASFFATATLRIFFAYGPGQQADRLIPRLLDNVRHGNPIYLDGANGLAINPIYVDDLVDIVLRAVARPAPLKINIAGTEVLTLRDIGGILGNIVGKAPVFVSRSSREAPSVVGDISAVVEKFGTRPATSFRDGARRLAEASQ